MIYPPSILYGLLLLIWFIYKTAQNAWMNINIIIIIKTTLLCKLCPILIIGNLFYINVTGCCNLLPTICFYLFTIFSTIPNLSIYLYKLLYKTVTIVTIKLDIYFCIKYFSFLKLCFHYLKPHNLIIFLKFTQIFV